MITFGLLLAAREDSPRTSNASTARQAIPAVSTPTLVARATLNPCTSSLSRRRPFPQAASIEHNEGRDAKLRPQDESSPRAHGERWMRLRGVEPPRPEGHRHLKPARLPVPPQPRACEA